MSCDHHPLTGRLTVLPDRDRSCMRKIVYATRVDAWDVAVEIYARESYVLRVYPCRYGDHWHLATARGSASRKYHSRRLEKARRKLVARRARRSAGR